MPSYLVASAGETSISFSEDTFHSQKEGAFHLVFCREYAKLLILYDESMSYTAQHAYVVDYHEQSVSGKAGVL